MFDIELDKIEYAKMNNFEAEDDFTALNSVGEVNAPKDLSTLTRKENSERTSCIS